nr:MAG TPA: LYSOZYME, 4-METHYL-UMBELLIFERYL-N-ACETYL-CHITOBIOSE, N-ACETYL-MURAMIDASE, UMBELLIFERONE GLYCOSIDES [Caudoviricetes sp.]DAT68309.1 MAG TPA: LYSOZYME, 4-METHYL-UMBELLIFERYL-N-ACETYL-CHITOBIOSE, N-ACETYL-MURAMIDASE, UMBELLIFERONE GLYCOSIDES [Caudoviricetes sp.]
MEQNSAVPLNSAHFVENPQGKPRFGVFQFHSKK